MEPIKVGCFREYQNSIEDSVHALLGSEINRIGVPRFKVSATKIDASTRASFRFKGLARASGAARSMHGFNIFWIEEAQFLSDYSIKELFPTIREDDSEIWLSMNPQSSADPASQRFLEPFINTLNRDGYYEDDLHLIVKINYDDNPFFPAVLEKDRLFDFEYLSRSEYNHIWLGAYNDTVEGSIISAEWFDAAIDAHKKLGFQPVGRKIVSFDPSDEGPDDKGLVVRHGSVIIDADFKTTGDAADGMDWALNRALDVQADFFTWDCDGLGIALKRQVSQALTGKHTKWAIFKGSESVDRPYQVYDDTGDYGKNMSKTNHQIFRNKRAQYYGALQDRFRNTFLAVIKGEYINPDRLISVSSDIKCLVQLKSEICRIPKKYNANGLFQIMNKEEMRKLKIKSPNLSDSAMMSMRVVDVNDMTIPFIQPPQTTVQSMGY